jgi:hypothetical protein
VTDTINHWRNAAPTDSRTIKEVVTRTYSGTTPPQGALVSATRVLQSYH